MRSLRIVWLGLALLLLAGCGSQDTATFQEVVKHEQILVDVNQTGLMGGERLEFRVSVPGDVVHPSFEGRWSFTDRERAIDVYVIPAATYVDTLPPAQLQGTLFSSLLGAVEGIGTLRAKEMHVHPKPGDWVLLFYNGAEPGPLSRAEFSSTIALTYFK